MIRSISCALASFVALASSIIVSPDIYTVQTKAEFLAGAGQYFPYSDNYGTCILSPSSFDGAVVYSSPSEFPDDKTNLTAYVASPVVDWPSSDSEELLDGSKLYYYRSLGPEGYHWQSFSGPTDTYLGPYYVRCYYYNGVQVPATTPIPIFAGNGGSFEYSDWFLMLCVWPLSDASLAPPSSVSSAPRLDDYYVPLLGDTSEFTPSAPDIEGDTPLGLVYNLGVWLNDSASVLSDFFNFKIFGYPFYQLLFGTGFMIFVGWSILRFIIP